MNKFLQGASACVAGVLIMAAGAQAADTDWVQESNQNAMLLLQVQAKYAPEFAGRTGVEGLDDKIFDLKQGVYERSRKDTEQALAELKKRQKTATDPNVQSRISTS